MLEHRHRNSRVVVDDFLIAARERHGIKVLAELDDGPLLRELVAASIGDLTLEVFVDVFEVGIIVHGVFDATLKRHLLHELLDVTEEVFIVLIGAL